MNNPLSIVTETELSKLLRIAQHQHWTTKFSYSGLRSQNKQTGTGSEISGYSSYSPGDDVRNIDWRQSARSKEPQIREYHKAYSAEWYICLDISSSMALPTQEKWNRGIQLTAAIAYLLLGMNNKAGIIIFDEKVRFASKPQGNNLHYHNIHKYLAQLTPPKPGRNTNLLSCLPFIGKRNPVFIISDLLMENNASNALLQIKQDRNNIHIIQLTQKFMEFQTDNKFVEIMDCESGQTAIIENCSKTISQSNINQHNYNNAIHEFCRLNNISLTQIEASREWFSVILKHLKYTVK